MTRLFAELSGHYRPQLDYEALTSSEHLLSVAVRSAALKAQVGLEALKEIQPVHVIAAKHQVHPTQVNQWKKEVAERLPEVFSKQAVPGALAAK